MTVIGAPAPFRIAFDAARDPYTARNALGITSSGGGVSSATPPLSITGGVISIDLSGYVLKTGDTMSGDLHITKAAPALTLNKTAGAGNNNSIYGTVSGTLPRWQMMLGNGTAESGGNAGSDFSINRFSDAGAFIDAPLSISRASGLVSAEFARPTVQIFGSGSGTYTKPAAAKWLRVRMIGGGGGGAGSGTTSPNGSAGGATTFGGMTVPGGGGGGGLVGANGGGTPSGVLGTALLVLGGANGESAVFGQVLHGGQGGGGFFGGRGSAGPLSTGGGVATAPGSGGGGAGATYATPTTAGGGGGGAGAYVETIITAPAASYSYAIGAAGTAGTAGTSGNAGGAGGAGVIIIEEYYL